MRPFSPFPASSRRRRFHESDAKSLKVKELRAFTDIYYEPNDGGVSCIRD